MVRKYVTDVETKMITLKRHLTYLECRFFFRDAGHLVVKPITREPKDRGTYIESTCFHIERT